MMMMMMNDSNEKLAMRKLKIILICKFLNFDRISQHHSNGR